MSQKLTLEDARQSLRGHVAEKGALLRQKYGPHLGWEELKSILQDRELIRYPCRIVFDAAPLQTGEFAYPAPQGDKPEDGFVLFIHPHFIKRMDELPWLALYQLVAVNYGEFASSEDAETFGASALGISVEEYYRGLCQFAEELKKSC